MTKFMVERTFHVTEDQMEFVGRRSNEVVRDQYPEITWHHSHVVVQDDGKVRTYCIYEAPTPEAIRRTAKANGLPVDRITEVQMVDPYVYV